MKEEKGKEIQFIYNNKFILFTEVLFYPSWCIITIMVKIHHFLDEEEIHVME
jgi:hypothetical protein